MTRPGRPVRAARRAGLALVLSAAGAWAASCGSSVDPRAPWDDPAAIPPPRNVRAVNLLAGGIDVSWGATAADRQVVDGWHVERRTTTQSAFTRLTTAVTLDTTVRDFDVADNVRFVYRVIAVTGAGVPGLPVESGPVRADLVAPEAPTGVTVQPRLEALEVGFVAGPEPDLAGFELVLVETGTTNPPEVRFAAGSPALVAGLVAGTQYAVTVAAVDSAGRSSAPSQPPVQGTPLAPAATARARPPSGPGLR